MIGWGLTALLAQYGDIVCLDYTQRIEPQRVQVARSHHDLAVDLKGREVGSGWSRGVQAPNVATVYGYLPQQKGRKPPPPTEIFSRLDCTAVHCHISRDSANLRGAMPGLKRGSLGQKSPSPAERTIRFPIEFFHDWTVASGYCSAIPLKSHYG